MSGNQEFYSLSLIGFKKGSPKTQEKPESIRTGIHGLVESVSSSDASSAKLEEEGNFSWRTASSLPHLLGELVQLVSHPLQPPGP